MNGPTFSFLLTLWYLIFFANIVLSVILHRYKARDLTQSVVKPSWMVAIYTSGVS